MRAAEQVGEWRRRVYPRAALLGLAAFMTFGWVRDQVSALQSGLFVHSDFAAFWAAGRLAWVDPMMSWSAPHLSALQHFSDPNVWVPFVNPPPFLMLVAPLGLLPAPLAHLVWMASTISLFLAAGRRYLGWAALLALPVVAINGTIGQNGLLTTAIMLGGLGLLDRRPFVAGMLLGALIIKPHLAVLLPVAMLAGRRWPTVAGAAVSSVCLLLISGLVLGFDTFPAFLHATDLSRAVLTSGIHALEMQTVFAFVLALGGGAHAAGAAQAVASLTAAVTVWRMWRGPSDTFAKSAMLAALIPFATPYAYVYDLGVWVLPLGWLLAEGRRGGFLPGERVAVGLLFAAPLLMSAAINHANAGPLVTLALVACLLRRQWRPAAPLRPAPRKQRAQMTRPCLGEGLPAGDLRTQELGDTEGRTMHEGPATLSPAERRRPLAVFRTRSVQSLQPR